MSWFRAESSLRSHPKIAKLAKRLSVCRPHALGLVTGLWAWACDTAPDGNLSSYDAEDLAIAAEWDGQPEDFLDALVGVRLIDREDGKLSLHDWMERAEGYRRAQKEVARRVKKATRAPRVPHGGELVPLTDRPTDREDQTDRTTDVRNKDEQTELMKESFDRLVAAWDSKKELAGTVATDTGLFGLWCSLFLREFATSTKGDVLSFVEQLVNEAAKSSLILGTGGNQRRPRTLRWVLDPKHPARPFEVADGSMRSNTAAPPPPKTGQRSIPQRSAFEEIER